MDGFLRYKKLLNVLLIRRLNVLLIDILNLNTQINKTFIFIYLLDKNIITDTFNHILINKKIDNLFNKFTLKL